MHFGLQNLATMIQSSAVFFAVSNHPRIPALIAQVFFIFFDLALRTSLLILSFVYVQAFVIY